MRVAFDSNILLYLALVSRVAEDQRKIAQIENLLIELPDTVIRVVPYQVLGECQHVMTRYGYSREKCRTILFDWMNNFETFASSEAAFMAAIDLATDHKLQFWDALIINVAAEAGCTLLLSEDLQPGFAWRGLTIVNPFAETLDERLVRILNTPL